MYSAFDTNGRYIDRIFYVGIYLSPLVKGKGQRGEYAYHIGAVHESRLVFTPQRASKTVLVVGHVRQILHATSRMVVVHVTFA